MKFLLLIFLVIVGEAGFTQTPLEFSELGSEPAYCRLFGYQNGNGVVYASATGGVPDYSTPQWTELATGVTAMTSTWGGRNPGLYEVMITDAMGTVLIDTIQVDSVNPISSFNVISDDLSEIPGGYIGFAPSVVEFENTSQYFANPAVPESDTTFFFQPQGFEPWTLYHDFNFTTTYTYEYGGTHTARLLVMNKNGCSDTSAVTIGIFGPLDIEENDQLGFFSLINNSNQIIIQKSGFQEGLILNLYTISGQQIETHMITDSKTEISLYLASGIYVYEVIDPVSGRLRDSGKLTF